VGWLVVEDGNDEARMGMSRRHGQEWRGETWQVVWIRLGAGGHEVVWDVGWGPSGDVVAGIVEMMRTENASGWSK
jgi:hypothetical protein